MPASDISRFALWSMRSCIYTSSYLLVSKVQGHKDQAAAPLSTHHTDRVESRMDIDTGAKGLSGIDILPPELQAYVASFTTIESARTLALTSKSWRDIAEMRIWETLDITSGRGSEIISKTYNEPIDLTPFTRRAAIVDSKLTHVLSGLDAHSPRAAHVKAIRVEPSDGENDSQRASALIRLIERFAPQLVRLAILPANLPDQESLGRRRPDDLDYMGFMSLLPYVQWPSLRQLKYNYGMTRRTTFDKWIDRMGVNLHELHISSADLRYFTEPFYTPPPNSLPLLRRLTFDNLGGSSGDDSLAILTMLLKAAPNIRALRLRGEWRPKADDPALVALAACEQLKSIILTQSGDLDHPPEEFEDEPGVRYGRLGAVNLAVEELVVEEPDWEETYEPSLISIRLPRADHLRQYTALTGSRPSPSKYIAYGIGPTPIHTSSTTRYDLANIRRCPLLCTIFIHHVETPFPSIRDPAFVEPTLFVDPSRWEAEGYRGCVLRQYINSLDPEDEFWHIRVLTRGIPDEHGNVSTGVQRCWHDFTLYKDKTVPRDVMEAMYIAAGEKWDFIQGGRSLELGGGQSAWAILRRWREEERKLGGLEYGDNPDYVGDWEDGLNDDESDAGANSENDAAFEDWMAGGWDPGSSSIGYMGYGPMGHFPDDGSSP